MDWQTLAELARECAALPKAGFKTSFPSPFLLEVDSEVGDDFATGLVGAAFIKVAITANHFVAGRKQRGHHHRADVAKMAGD